MHAIHDWLTKLSSLRSKPAVATTTTKNDAMSTAHSNAARAGPPGRFNLVNLVTIHVRAVSARTFVKSPLCEAARVLALFNSQSSHAKVHKSKFTLPFLCLSFVDCRRGLLMAEYSFKTLGGTDPCDLVK